MNMAGFMVENLAWDWCPEYRWDEVAKLPRDGSVQLIESARPPSSSAAPCPFPQHPLDELRERLKRAGSRAACAPRLPKAACAATGSRPHVGGPRVAAVSHLAGGLRFRDRHGRCAPHRTRHPCGADAC